VVNAGDRRTRHALGISLEVARFDEFAKFTKHLNELGRHGWEAVGITGNADATT
jgi:hypothetical protein